MRGEATVLAEEFGLTLPVSLLAMSTLATGAASIARIDQDDRYSGQLRLVGHELAQLGEGPTMESVTLVSATSRNPIADMRQLFQRNPTPGALGRYHQRFRDNMIRVLTEAGFLRSPASLRTADSFGTFPLSPLCASGFPQLPAPLTISATCLLDLFTRKGLPIEVTLPGDTRFEAGGEREPAGGWMFSPCIRSLRVI